ncbi:hypothetical protein [Parabacteroides sp. PF5-9]|uniref:hypothetical protein n=1 Tax=Parabacteroides sp. PF5-9 TaxID=1742404 RepID=UPI002476DD0B|nr:hypothetical protein [Parabacteroides sp. PF5-9]MDH6357407.1 hypothetical protein [Parabacteroides sp. PF5-9]
MKVRNLFLCVALVIAFVGCGQKDLFEGAQDIGDVKVPGSVFFDKKTGVYTMEAGGLNMWDHADAFFMNWKKVTGDFSLSADIAFEGEGTNAHRKIGLILREKLEPGSRYADIAVHGDGLTSLQYRKIEAGLTEEVVSAAKAPTSIYLERKGNTVLIRSGKGDLEISDAQVELELPEDCYVGLFICSHEDFILETGYFSNVVFKKR